MRRKIPSDILCLGGVVIIGVAEDCGVNFIPSSFGKHQVEGDEEQIVAFNARCREIVASSCQHISFFTATAR